MKFTKEEFISNVKKHLANKLLSDRSIDELAGSLILFADDEIELSDFVSKTLPMFKSADGNLRKDVSDKAKELEAKYAKPKDAVETEPVLTETEKMLKQLADDIKEIKEKKAESDKRENLLKNREVIISKYKSKYAEDVINIASKRFDFSSETADADFDTDCADIALKITSAPPSGGSGADKKPDFKKMAEGLGLK